MKLSNGLLAGLALLLLVTCAPRAFAQNTSLQDAAFNANGTFIDGGDSNFSSEVSAANIDLSGYNLTSGLGTITFTTTSSGFFDAGFSLPVSTPSYNEFAAAQGTLGSTESWEIDDADIDADATLFGNNLLNNTLNGKNTALAGASDYLGTEACYGQTKCNSDVIVALGDSFIIANPGDEEVITILVSQTNNGGGFYLDQTHPADGDNPTEQDVYYSLTAKEQSGNTPPPPVVPEPSSWLLVLTGLGAGAARLRRRLQLQSVSKLLAGLAVVAGLVMAPFAKAQSVSTVPWDPTNPAAPHTTYPLPVGAPTTATPTSEVTIVLGAIFNTGGSPDSFHYTWSFGDGSLVVGPTVLSNPNDISTTHVYPYAAAVGTTWTAVVTVSDDSTHAQYTGNYLVIQEPNKLQTRVNVAIDWGLWFLHGSMYHPSAGVGYWTSCPTGYYYSCGQGYGSLNAANVQAMEVNGHLASGPANDPLTSDVQEGLNAMFPYLSVLAPQATTYDYSTAAQNFGCSDGTAPTTTLTGPLPVPGGPALRGYCDAAATEVFYNPSGLGPLTTTFDGNNNHQAVYATQGGSWYYEDGQYADAIIASGTPNATAATGPAGVIGQTYYNIVQDIADAAAYCQYPHDYDVATNGAARGQSSGQGGGWWYSCQSGGDNSVSQWAAIGLIGAQRGFGISIPKIVTDANSVWVTNSQDVFAAHPVFNNPSQNAYNDAYGAFGYNASLHYSDPWGPYALTPSGMVQMSLDGIGRTANTLLGGGSNAPDQRFNNAETYYADNFCNDTALGAGQAPRAYTYGMFSFTKAMLLHNPGGVLTPIQYLQTQTSGVFSNPANPNGGDSIDWYSALSATNGGVDLCDGVAQTLVERQYSPNNAPNVYGQNYAPGGYPGGFWWGDNYTGAQDFYETAWSLIMLQRTVFVNCVNNLQGAGLASGIAPARIDLTWTGIPNVSSYNVLRSSSNGGPYTLQGTTTTTAYSDRTGLTNGKTYYYVLQPTNGAGAVCQSNQATVMVPNKKGL